MSGTAFTGMRHSVISSPSYFEDMERFIVKWSCFLGQVCGLAKMYQVFVHAAFRIFTWTKYAASGVLLSSAGVRALRIVKSNPVIADPFCLETVGDFMQIDGRLFQRPPQPLDKDVVQIAAPAIH